MSRHIDWTRLRTDGGDTCSPGLDTTNNPREHRVSTVKASHRQLPGIAYSRDLVKRRHIRARIEVEPPSLASSRLSKLCSLEMCDLGLHHGFPRAVSSAAIEMAGSSTNSIVDDSRRECGIALICKMKASTPRFPEGRDRQIFSCDRSAVASPCIRRVTTAGRATSLSLRLNSFSCALLARARCTSHRGAHGHE